MTKSSRISFPSLAFGGLAVSLALSMFACGSAPSAPQLGSQTNWMRRCDSSADCGGLDCLCGTCTSTCRTDQACAGLARGTCEPASSAAATALCSGTAAPSGLCVSSCGSEPCPAGQLCAAGACVPAPAATETVTIQTDQPEERLVGFGASIAFTSIEISEHPRFDDLVSAMFVESGLDAVRTGNDGNLADTRALDAVAKVLRSAEDQSARRPLFLLTEGSPPAALKANDSTLCEGNPDTCTLKTLEDGSFDYPGLAAHWRTSLDKYASAQIPPDFVSIQNNPNWVPPEGASLDACRFLPAEGTTDVDIAGETVSVRYAGYAEALAAVREATADMSTPPKFLGPEVSTPADIRSFAESVEEPLSAIGIHIYGQDPVAPDWAKLQSVAQIGQDLDLPILQTELSAPGFETALLIHAAMSTGNATAFLSNSFAASAGALEPDTGALIALGDDSFTLQEPYYAFQHYALHTEPGWLRVPTGASSTGALRSIAWVNPARDHLTLVLVNSSAQALTARVDLAGDHSSYRNTTVLRTVFGAVEKASDLGSLDPTGKVIVPSRGMVTIAFSD